MASPSLLLLGCGKMGTALAQGWMTHPHPPELTIIDRQFSPGPEEHNLQAGQVFRSVQELPSSYCPDLIVLAVKPAVADPLLGEISTHLGQKNLQHTALLSIMAGKSCETLARAIGREDMPVIRAMPNTPAAVQAATTGLYFSAHVTQAQKDMARTLMERVGTVIIVPHEDDLRSVTAISGSGPAYVFLLAELLEKAGITLGLSEQTSCQLARNMIYGAGKMLHDCPETTETLRKNVTSPNGTTAAALDIFMKPENWPATVLQATEAARKRAAELDN